MDRYFPQKFRKIINDLKRRPEDAAADLGVGQEIIENILNGKKYADFELIKKAINVWPVNYADFFSIEDDTKNGFRIFKKDLAQYQDVMNKRHPDFKKLKAFVDQFKKIIDQNNNEKIAEDLFKVFKDSLGDYLSLRKKARAGIFNYVKRYGNVVKIAV